MYEELLHIPALSHLSTSIKRELASIIVFESHAHAGTVCELNFKRKLPSPSASLLILFVALRTLFFWLRFHDARGIVQGLVRELCQKSQMMLKARHDLTIFGDEHLCTLG